MNKPNIDELKTANKVLEYYELEARPSYFSDIRSLVRMALGELTTPATIDDKDRSYLVNKYIQAIQKAMVKTMKEGRNPNTDIIWAQLRTKPLTDSDKKLVMKAVCPDYYNKHLKYD